MRCTGMLGVLICAFATSLSFAQQDRDVSGTVVDINGKPLSEVRIYGFQHNRGGGYIHVSALTDENGRFELRQVGRPLFAQKKNYDPAVTVLKESETSSSFVLQPMSPRRKIPPCDYANERGKHIGFIWDFTIPKGVKSKTSSGDDTWDVAISYPKAKYEKMIVWSGPWVGGGQVDDVGENYLLESKSFTLRVWDEYAAFDYAGTSKKDQRWRYMSLYGDIAYYRNVSPEAAAFFDTIFDSVCAGGSLGRTEYKDAKKKK